MSKKTKESKKTNTFFWLIIIIIAVFYFNSNKGDVSSKNNEPNSTISTNNEDKWVDAYNQIKSEDMIKVGDIIYIYEKDEYIPAMEVLNIDTNVEMENGYISKKAMQVSVCGNTDDIFWKDIEQTLKTSLSEYGLKYYTKGKKYNP